MAYVPHGAQQLEEMLRSIGVSADDELFSSIPEHLRLREPLDIPAAADEWAVTRQLDRLADLNRDQICFAGGGLYDRYVPAAVNHMLLRSEWYTAYTPYQPEVAQGTLQAIYEFQTMVCEIYGMDVANASLYDGPSALAEAFLMARGLAKGRSGVLLPRSLHPHYRRVLSTYNVGHQDRVIDIPFEEDGRLDLDAVSSELDGAATLVVQQPNFFGVLEDLPEITSRAQDAGALVIVVADPLAAAVTKSPGECGADIVVGEGQQLGIPMSFGGPVLGLFATKSQNIRKMPGRIAGATEDVEGRRGFVLTLQTREQQIRREKATSNICTNQGLLALAATIHLSMLGREGLRRVTLASVEKAHETMEKITALPGYEAAFSSPFLFEFTVRTPRPARDIVHQAAREGILPGVALDRFEVGFGLESGDENNLLVAVTEKRTDEEIDLLVETLRKLS